MYHKGQNLEKKHILEEAYKEQVYTPSQCYKYELRLKTLAWRFLLQTIPSVLI